MTLWLYAFLFLTATLFELVYTTWGWAVATKRRWLAVLMTAAMPWIGILELICLIDAKSTNERLFVCVITSSGFALGTWLVLTFAPKQEPDK